MPIAATNTFDIISTLQHWLGQHWFGLNTPVFIERLSIYHNYIEVALIFAGATFLFLKMGRIRAARPFLQIFMAIICSYFVVRLFNFEIIARILEVTFSVMTLGFMVLFQPELRRLVIASGGSSWLDGESWGNKNHGSDKTDIFKELYDTIRILSKTRIGALIVLQNHVDEDHAYLEIGTPIRAKLSSELLLTIFHPNTPLHDGALIISPSGEIISAGVLLPLSENSKLSWEYGTRHRAAVGLSEISDSICFIVSEETGRVSMAEKGNITRLPDNDAIREALENALGIHHHGKTAIKRGHAIHELFPVSFFQKLLSSGK